MTFATKHAVNPARRRVLQSSLLAAGASLLPFGAGLAQPPARARWRRPSASGSKMGGRMLESYARAVRAMLALPPEDPRNWYRQAIIHTLDCPHGNWWFLPWHRGYLGWFEQVCRELSGDPQFALPYWDWTAEQRLPEGMFDGVLDPNHSAFVGTAPEFEARLAAAVANSGYWTSPGGVYTRNSQYGQLLARNVRFDADLMFDILRDPSGRLFYEQPGARGIVRERPGISLATADAVAPATIRAALDAPDFPTFASPKSANHSVSAGFGVLEARPHNSVHRCVGSRDCNFTETRGFMADMLSPVDPVFFLHHANIDRLWEVWTRRQTLLGLPTLPAGVELRTDLPDDQKSAAERATDYYRWAREPLLFFVDGKGAPVSQTRAGDYEATGFFDYDYEAGSGEETLPKAASAMARPQRVARRVFPGSVLSRAVGGARPATAQVKVTAGTLESAVAAGQTVVANITLNFPQACRDPYIVILNGPENPHGIDAGSPFYLATIVMFGHRGSCGALSFALPLGTKLSGARGAGSSDDALRLRVVPMHAMMGHHGMDEADVELVAANVEVY